MKKLLIIEDSSFMRSELKRICSKITNLEIYTAANGEEGIIMAMKIRPNVITMDVNMPKMDGLSSLAYIMDKVPTPVIMISSLTENGALNTYEALELGAFDYIHKPSGTISNNLYVLERDILAKIQEALNVDIQQVLKNKNRLHDHLKKNKESVLKSKNNLEYAIEKGNKLNKVENIVLIGQSTGGPNTIMEIVPYFTPKNFNAVLVIVQHMPGSFTSSFAKRIQSNTQIPFKLVSKGEQLQNGHGYLAVGDLHLHLQREDEKYYFNTSKLPMNTLHTPSVDVTFFSALEIFEPKNIISVILTGMGSDGAEAAVQIKNHGGYSICESEETAVVFGMPKETIVRGGASEILPSFKIGERIIQLLNKG